jgi:hypothetical protein
MTTDSGLRLLLDRAEISHVVYCYAAALDRLDWPLMRGVLADRVTIDYSSFDRTINREMSADEWVSMLKLLVGSVRTQHISTNHRHTIEGDTAECHSYMQSARLLTGPDGDYYVTLYGQYTHGLARETGGWKITKCVLELMPYA